MEAGKNPLKLRTRKKYDVYHGRKRLWRYFYKDSRDVGFYEIYLEPETATEKPIIRIEIYGFNIYEKANAESILLTEEDIQKAGRGGVKSILRDYLGENTDFVCDYLIKDFEEMKDYRDELVKAERGKEEKKETKPKEEAVVEKLAELIEEKERLAKERAEERGKEKKTKAEEDRELPLKVERILNLIEELQKRGKTGKMFASALLEKLTEELIEEVEKEALNEAIYIVADETGKVYLKTHNKAEAGYKASMLSMKYPDKLFTIYRRVSPNAPLEKLERWKNARPETIVPFSRW